MGRYHYVMKCYGPSWSRYIISELQPLGDIWIDSCERHARYRTRELIHSRYHQQITAVLCAKMQNYWITETDVMGTRFEFKISFGYLSYITQQPPSPQLPHPTPNPHPPTPNPHHPHSTIHIALKTFNDFRK